MGETARERYHRERKEMAGGVGIAPQGGAAVGLLGALGEDAHELAARAAIQGTSAAAASSQRATAVAHKLRKTALAARVARLGVPTAVDELPDDERDLADLERMCAEQERAAPSK